MRNLTLDPIEYSPMPEIWCRWVANKLREHRDMQTLAEQGVKFFDVDLTGESSSPVDWNTVTVSEVENG